MQSSPLIFVHYAEVRHSIQDGDLLLVRRRGLISRAGRGVHSHAAKAAWWDNALFCLEVREWHGGRAVRLSSQIARQPGRIDVFAPNADSRWPDYNLYGSLRLMRSFAGCCYGYRSLLRASLLHLPLLRLITQAEMDDAALNGWPPFCSHAVALAERLGGLVDVVPHLADHLTEPADLARSPFYKYRFTLLP